MFKVGDKVRVLNDRDGAPVQIGTIGVVSSDDDQRCLTVEINDDFWAFTSNNLELVNTLHDNYNPFAENKKILTLPTDSEARKQIPMFSGCIKYFPAAIAGVAKISKAGNDKHNPGQELHHDRSKSLDHPDCIVRHLADVADLIAKLERGENTNPEQILAEVSSLAWRALAYSQTLHEKYDGAPLAPGAK